MNRTATLPVIVTLCHRLVTSATTGTELRAVALFLVAVDQLDAFADPLRDQIFKRITLIDAMRQTPPANLFTEIEALAEALQLLG